MVGSIIILFVWAWCKWMCNSATIPAYKDSELAFISSIVITFSIIVNSATDSPPLSNMNLSHEIMLFTFLRSKCVGTPVNPVSATTNPSYTEWSLIFTQEVHEHPFEILMIPSPYQHRFQNTISLYRNDIILHFLFSSRDFGSTSGKSISIYGAMMYPVSRITNSDCEERSFSLFHHLSGNTHCQ